jgi:hypothetical protein
VQQKTYPNQFPNLANIRTTKTLIPDFGSVASAGLLQYIQLTVWQKSNIFMHARTLRRQKPWRLSVQVFKFVALLNHTFTPTTLVPLQGLISVLSVRGKCPIMGQQWSDHLALERSIDRWDQVRVKCNLSTRPRSRNMHIGSQPPPDADRPHLACSNLPTVGVMSDRPNVHPNTMHRQG